jgi:hypothetical protein
MATIYLAKLEGGLRLSFGDPNALMTAVYFQDGLNISLLRFRTSIASRPPVFIRLYVPRD